MKIFEHLTQLDNAVGFYRKGIIAILIVCAIFMTAMYIHTETRILQATSSAYILNQDGDVAIATRIRAAEFRKIEAEAHVRLFIMLFFDIDKYTYEQRISSTYALGNSSIYALKQRQLVYEHAPIQHFPKRADNRLEVCRRESADGRRHIHGNDHLGSP